MRAPAIMIKKGVEKTNKQKTEAQQHRLFFQTTSIVLLIGNRQQPLSFFSFIPMILNYG
jgi:hypothetical protein